MLNREEFHFVLVFKISTLLQEQIESEIVEPTFDHSVCHWSHIVSFSHLAVFADRDALLLEFCCHFVEEKVLPTDTTLKMLS